MQRLYDAVMKRAAEKRGREGVEEDRSSRRSRWWEEEGESVLMAMTSIHHFLATYFHNVGSSPIEGILIPFQPQHSLLLSLIGLFCVLSFNFPALFSIIYIFFLFDSFFFFFFLFSPYTTITFSFLNNIFSFIFNDSLDHLELIAQVSSIRDNYFTIYSSLVIPKVLVKLEGSDLRKVVNGKRKTPLQLQGNREDEVKEKVSDGEDGDEKKLTKFDDFDDLRTFEYLNCVQLPCLHPHECHSVEGKENVSNWCHRTVLLDNLISGYRWLSSMLQLVETLQKRVERKEAGSQVNNRDGDEGNERRKISVKGMLVTREEMGTFERVVGWVNRAVIEESRRSSPNLLMVKNIHTLSLSIYKYIYR